MKITHLKINHIENPLGFGIEKPSISYIVEETSGKKQEKAQVLVAKDSDFSSLVFDSGETKDIKNTGYVPEISLETSTRYYYKVKVWADNGDTAESDVAWFETPKDDNWVADWITPKLSKEVQVSVEKTVQIEKDVEKARMYMVGLGVYELYLNEQKQGDECLLPGFHDYDSWIQYQTFELDLKTGENKVEVLLGDGWYKGQFGISKKEENYGDKLACIGELHIWYKDGSKEIVSTDTSWKARKSKVVASGIYPGETYDATLDVSEVFETELIELDKKKLAPRLSPKITVHERLTPIEVIHTPAGETVLDMGQNMVGWLQFHCTAPAGTRLHFQMGEILQEGNFYNDNLRKAKAEFIYISDGIEKDVTQHFTFYGFRFVKVEGWEGELKLEDFKGLVIHSDMEELGHIETSDPLVNQLFHNAKWGQKGNFLDVPTDCPQRDERCGWTGDAQIFSGTASFNMDTYAFYAKYGHDVYAEQKKLNGSVPDIVPVANFVGDASTAWGEAATVIPWNVYLHYGDKGILELQYDSMKAWVDYMKREDDKYGSKRLWQSGFHYADWLALDGNYEGGVYGATDPFLISSGYYYYSTNILAKAAKIIGKEEDAAFYTNLAQEIYDAFVKEYFTPNGRLCVNTMTAYVVVLYMGLTPDFAHEATCKGLLKKLKENRYHLNTGFVGTPYLCRVLSENGMNDIAYHLLLEKGFPGWLYEVLMGATTIWERWNSVMPDGKISGTEMNSLNHYAYGSIVEWMYRNMVGIQPMEDMAGFKAVRIAPKPNYQIPWAKGSLRSAAGLIKSEWRIEGKKLNISVEIPFDGEGEIVLPDAPYREIEAMAAQMPGVKKVEADQNDVKVYVQTGIYQFEYEPTVPYRKIYNIDCPVDELAANEKTKKILDEMFYSIHRHIPFEKELYTMEEMINGPFTSLPYEKQRELDERLRAVE